MNFKSTFEQNSNQILARLPQEIQNRIRSGSETLPMNIGQVIFESQSIADFVHFPENHGVISVIRQLKDGSMVEVGVVGDEGISGVHGFLGVGKHPDRGVCQNSGTILKTPSRLLREEGARNPVLLDTVLRYVNALLVQITQTAACNRLHTLERRLSRWLLMMHDRVRTDALIITQEFLSYMLGTRIAGVNEAVRTLTDSGLIRHGRNRIEILDRGGLEMAACECYDYVQQETRRTFGGH